MKDYKLREGVLIFENTKIAKDYLTGAGSRQDDFTLIELDLIEYEELREPGSRKILIHRATGRMYAARLYFRQVRHDRLCMDTEYYCVTDVCYELVEVIRR